MVKSIKQFFKKIFSSKKTKKSSQKGGRYIDDPNNPDKQRWTYEIDPAGQKITEHKYKSLINGKYFKTEEEALKDDMNMTGLMKEELQKILNGTTQINIGLRYNPKTGELIGNNKTGYNYEYTNKTGKIHQIDTKNIAKARRMHVSEPERYPQNQLPHGQHIEESRFFDYTLGDKVQHHKDTQASAIARQYFNIMTMPHKGYYQEFGLNTANRTTGKTYSPLLQKNIIVKSMGSHGTVRNNNVFTIDKALHKKEVYKGIKDTQLALDGVKELHAALDGLTDDAKKFINNKMKEDSLRYDLLQYVQQKTQNKEQKELKEGKKTSSTNTYGIGHRSNQQLPVADKIQAAIYKAYDVNDITCTRISGALASLKSNISQNIKNGFTKYELDNHTPSPEFQKMLQQLPGLGSETETEPDTATDSQINYEESQKRYNARKLATEAASARGFQSYPESTYVPGPSSTPRAAQTASKLNSKKKNLKSLANQVTGQMQLNSSSYNLDPQIINNLHKELDILNQDLAKQKNNKQDKYSKIYIKNKESQISKLQYYIDALEQSPNAQYDRSLLEKSQKGVKLSNENTKYLNNAHSRNSTRRNGTNPNTV